MTTILNTELLLSTLASRIREMNHAPGNHTPASVLEDLYEEIERGEYGTDLDDTSVPVQDPLEAAADRVLESPKITHAVREIPVGDVVSVQTILYRRADEHEKQAAVIRERRAQMTDALQGLLSAEEREGDAAAAMEREAVMHGEALAWRGGYTTRNGGR